MYILQLIILYVYNNDFLLFNILLSLNNIFYHII